MARFLTLGDCANSTVKVKDEHLDGADVYVAAELWGRGINPDDVPLPNPMLNQMAVAWAKQLACIDGAIGENSLLIGKARSYLVVAESIAKGLTRDALGLTVEAAGEGFGSVSLGRG